MKSELGAIPWLGLLEPAVRVQVASHLEVQELDAGEVLCPLSGEPTHWWGTMTGFMQFGANNPQKRRALPPGAPPGSWFGEFELLATRPYGLQVSALRASVVAGIPIVAFQSLIGQSLAFNQFLVHRLADCLGRQAERENTWVLDPDSAVSATLAVLFREQLKNGGVASLDLTQVELGRLIGLSRQRVNEALSKLQRRELVKLEYGRIRGVELDELEVLRTRGTDSSSTSRRRKYCRNSASGQ